MRPPLKPTPVLLLLLFVPALSLAELKIENAWIQNLPPSVPMRAGYLTMTNKGTNTVTIRKIDCEACTSIEMHESVMRDGMMSMQPLPTLTIEPTESATLAPGGKHLMLQPRQPTQIGERMPITLHLEDGSSHTVEFIVRE